MARIILLSFLLVIGGSLRANPPLAEVDHVRNGLIIAAIVIEIAETCPDLRVRELRGLAYLNGLKRHAQGLGYSNDEIDDYIDDRDEKRRLEGIATDWIAQQGAVTGEPDTFCDVGKAEIDRGSQVGRLLR